MALLVALPTVALMGRPRTAAAAPPATRAAAPAWFPSDSAMRSILAARIEAGFSTGLVVGLLENGKTRVFAAGKSDGPGGRPLDGATVFEIGSITKAFTGILLAEMVGRGEVGLDQPLADVLPKSFHVPSRGDTVITLLDLATHRSGLPRLPSNMTETTPMNPYADYTGDMLGAFLDAYQLTWPPGIRYEYSNLGMGLLGYALALKAYKPYEALVVERVLKPLQMDDTRITLTPGMKERLAAGHNDSGAVVPNWDFQALAGAGALRSTANDMLRFLAANLDSNATPLNIAIRLSHEPRRQTLSATGQIGLAWHLFAGSQIVMHNGGTGGYRSFVGFNPFRRVGVVVLSNSTGDVDDIGFHLLDPSRPLKSTVRRTEVKLDPARLPGLVGHYAIAPTFILSVTQQGEGLFIQAPGQRKFRAYAESDTSFFVREVDAQFTFTRDSTGKASRIVLHQMGRSQPGRRVQ
jgi:CubicO group peptidase (beta-lactamase class C family)